MKRRMDHDGSIGDTSFCLGKRWELWPPVFSDDTTVPSPVVLVSVTAVLQWPSTKYWPPYGCREAITKRTNGAPFPKMKTSKERRSEGWANKTFSSMT